MTRKLNRKYSLSVPFISLDRHGAYRMDVLQNDVTGNFCTNTVCSQNRVVPNTVTAAIGKCCKRLR